MNVCKHFVGREFMLGITNPDRHSLKHICLLRAKQFRTWARLEKLGTLLKVVATSLSCECTKSLLRQGLVKPDLNTG